MSIFRFMCVIPLRRVYMYLWDCELVSVHWCIRIGIDYLKITEDKLSENRVCNLNARLIIATYAVPRRKGRSPRLRITAMAKTQSLKPTSQHHYSTKTQSLKVASQYHCSTKTQESKPTSQLHCNSEDAELKAATSKIQSRHQTAL